MSISTYLLTTATSDNRKTSTSQTQFFEGAPVEADRSFAAMEKTTPSSSDQADGSNGADWFFSAPTQQDVSRAASSIRNRVRVTPILESQILNQRTGGRILLKAESLQVTGSFKARGALNRMLLLSPEQQHNGVVCYSSGNHGHAVAWAARQLGLQAIVAMPDDAPSTKVSAVRWWGGQIVPYSRKHDDREAIVGRLASEHGTTIIHAHNDRAVIAGAGTVGLEAVEQAGAMGLSPDAILVGCGGGGLAAGCMTACHSTELFIVEPDGYDDTTRSLALGRRVKNDSAPESICDALLAPTPSDLPFRILSDGRVRGLSIGDREARYAMRYVAAHFGLIVEPGGVLPLAALLAGRFDASGRTVIAVISGANVDLAASATILGSEAGAIYTLAGAIAL